MNYYNHASHARTNKTTLVHWFKALNYVVMIIILGIALGACHSGDGTNDSGGAAVSAGGTEGADNSNSTNSVAARVSGVAQKGPYQPGANASAVSLTTDGSTSGMPVTAAIEANGAYELPDLDWDGPTLLTMSGSSFNEFTGDFTGDLELHGVASLPGDEAANINLFTHLVAARTRHLMEAGTNFEQARDQARSDWERIVGITASPSSLNVMKDTSASQDDSANLLLFSAATLAAGINQTDLDAMAKDFADDGRINGDGKDDLDDIQQAAATPSSLLTTARNNLRSQYSVEPPNNTSGNVADWTQAAPTPLVAKFTHSGSLLEGDAQSFDATGSTGEGKLTYLWNFGDGSPLQLFGAENDHTFRQAGRYTVSLTVTEEDTNLEKTVSHDLTITKATQTPEPPTAEITGGASNVTGRSLGFSAANSTGASLEYAWTFGDGSAPASGEEVSHVYADAGNYTVKLIVTDSAQQTATAEKQLTIEASQWIEHKIEASDREGGEKFGSAVALNGNTAVVGAPNAKIGYSVHGKAYQFSRDVNDNWSEQKIIEGGSLAYLGGAIAMDSSYYAVGAEYQSNSQGAVHIYRKDTGAYVDTLWAESPTSQGFFGESVDISGNTIVVGAKRTDPSTDPSGDGVATVFSPNANGDWEIDQILKPYSYSVAIDGGTIVLGGANIVTIFTNETGTWTKQATLSLAAEDRDLDTSFALDGNTLFVQVRIYTEDGGVKSSSVYTYQRQNGSWEKTGELTGDDTENNEYFGDSMDIDGDRAVIGASNADAVQVSGAPRVYDGAAYVYDRQNDGSWARHSKLVGSEGDADDVAIDGNTIMVGANAPGVVYIFTPREEP